jgi:hypothetical protein
MQAVAWAVIACSIFPCALAAQVPQPFPRPGQSPQRPAPATPTAPAQTGVASLPTPEPGRSDPAGTAPTEASLGVPIYPDAQFLTSYDAGKGQRYYLFGSPAAFPELVKYYQTALKTKGTLVFETPATQVFEVGKFREETMAFPPGVTIKDYTWGGNGGYLNPNRDGKPARFPSIIQIVAVTPGVR